MSRPTIAPLATDFCLTSQGDCAHHGNNALERFVFVAALPFLLQVIPSSHNQDYCYILADKAVRHWRSNKRRFVELDKWGLWFPNDAYVERFLRSIINNVWMPKWKQKVNDLPANVRQSLIEKIFGPRRSTQANTAVVNRERLADVSSVSRSCGFSPQSHPVETKVKKPMRVMKPLPNEYCVGQRSSFHIGNRRFEVLALSVALPILLKKNSVSEPDDVISQQAVDKWHDQGGRFLFPDPEFRGRWVPVLERHHAVTEIRRAISNGWKTMWMNKLEEKLPTIFD
jgi:hypothetical protein